MQNKPESVLHEVKECTLLVAIREPKSKGEGPN